MLRHTRGARGQSSVLPGDLELVEVGVEVRQPSRELRQLHPSFFRLAAEPSFHCGSGVRRMKGGLEQRDDAVEHGTRGAGAKRRVNICGAFNRMSV